MSLVDIMLREFPRVPEEKVTGLTKPDFSEG